MDEILITRVPRPWDWCRGESERKQKWDYRRIRLTRLKKEKDKRRGIITFEHLKRNPLEWAKLTFTGLDPTHDWYFNGVLIRKGDKQ